MEQKSWKENNEYIDELLEFIKKADYSQITLWKTKKNNDFIKSHNMQDIRWKRILKTLTCEEYEESRFNDISDRPEKLHIFFITRILANIVYSGESTCKIYVKTGVDEENLVVVSFHEPEYPMDNRFDR